MWTIIIFFFVEPNGEQKVEGEQPPAQRQAEGENKEEQQQQQDPQAAKIDELQKKVKDLEEQNKELNGNYLRSLADLDNMARIGKTNVENAKLYSIKSFAEGMLEISDNLSRALDSLPEEKRGLPDVKVLFEGVAMTERVLQQVFARYGIKKFNPLNEKFDPTKSSALFEIQDPTKAPGTVAFVQAPGYTLHDRLLRAAQVGVVAQPPDEPSSSSSSSDQA